MKERNEDERESADKRNRERLKYIKIRRNEKQGRII